MEMSERSLQHLAHMAHGLTKKAMLMRHGVCQKCLLVCSHGTVTLAMEFHETDIALAKKLRMQRASQHMLELSGLEATRLVLRLGQKLVSLR